MEEKTYHNRLIGLLFNTCSKVIRKLLQCLIQNQQTYASVNEFVERKKYEILGKRIGSKNEDILFPTRRRPTDIQNWDFQLLCFIIYDILKPEQEIKNAIDVLRRVRNELCHGSSTFIKLDVYEKKSEMILKTTNTLLDKVGDTQFKREILTQNDEIINDRVNISEALNALIDWLEMDKKLLLQKCTFNEKQKEILTYMKSFFQSEENKQKQISGTRLVLSVKNCRSEEEDTVSRKIMQVVKKKTEQSPKLQSMTDEQNAELDRIIEEAFEELFPRGLVPVTADLGCVIIFVTDETFINLEQLWTRCINGDLNRCLSKLQSYLREIYRNQIEIEIILPEVEFWEVIEKIVDDLKVKIPDGRRFKLPMPADVNVDDDETQVPAKSSCLEGRVERVNMLSSSPNGAAVEILLKPKTYAEMNHLTVYSRSGKLESNFKSMEKQLKEHLKIGNFEINAKMDVLDSSEQTSAENDIPKDEADMSNSYQGQAIRCSSDELVVYDKSFQSSSDELDNYRTVTEDKMVTRNGLHILVGSCDIVKSQEVSMVLWTTKSLSAISFPDEMNIFTKSLRRALIDKIQTQFIHGMRNGDAFVCKKTKEFGDRLGDVYIAVISDDQKDTKYISRVVRKCLEIADTKLNLSLVFTSPKCLGEQFCTYEIVKAMFQAVLEFGYISPKMFIKYVYFTTSRGDRIDFKLYLNVLHELKEEEIQLHERCKQEKGNIDIVTQKGMHISMVEHDAFEMKEEAFCEQLNYRNTCINQNENFDDNPESGPKVSVVEKGRNIQLKSQGDSLVIFVETLNYLELALLGETGLQRDLLKKYPHGLGFKSVVTSAKPKRLSFRNVYVSRLIPLFIVEKVTECLTRSAACKDRSVVFVIPETFADDGVLKQIMFRATAEFDDENPECSVKDVQFLYLQETGSNTKEKN